MPTAFTDDHVLGTVIGSIGCIWIVASCITICIRVGLCRCCCCKDSTQETTPATVVTAGGTAAASSSNMVHPTPKPLEMVAMEPKKTWDIIPIIIVEPNDTMHFGKQLSN